MAYQKDEAIIRELVQEETEQFSDVEEKMARLLRILNHNGVLSDADIIEVEA